MGYSYNLKLPRIVESYQQIHVGDVKSPKSTNSRATSLREDPKLHASRKMKYLEKTPIHGSLREHGYAMSFGSGGQRHCAVS